MHAVANATEDMNVNIENYKMFAFGNSVWLPHVCLLSD